MKKILIALACATPLAAVLPAAAQTPDVTGPALTCGAATSAWHAADVSIACTASDAESGLANEGDASFVLTTTVPAGTETAHASTDERQVCDVAGNCATAGPFASLRVDKRAPANPNVRSTDHRIRRWSRDRRVTMSVRSAGDGGSGVHGFSIAWTRSAGTAPDTVMDRSRSVTSMTSPRLANGRWYFHLRTRDKVGNWSHAIHRGPYLVDRTAPSVRALSRRGKVGRTLALRYRTGDGSGNTRERLTVSRGGRIIASWKRRMAWADWWTTQSASWTPRAAGSYRFCVRALDRAGNSRRDCAGVRVRKSAPPTPRCHPSYIGQCLNPKLYDYDCAGGSGDGPGYVYTTVRVVGYDEYRLDADGDGWGCD